MLEELAKKYYSDESGNLKLQNRWDQLFALFYRIPFGKVGEVNPERDIIDKITERSGGRSMEPDHIIKAVDNLCMELVSVM
ncbi:hypothetical protein HQ531_13760 [bacterium]|nr:hypothetical protein [bacterium]